MRSKQAAEQLEKRRLEKRKNKLAKVATRHAAQVNSETPSELIHEINVSNPVMPNDNISMMGCESMEAWAFKTDSSEPVDTPTGSNRKPKPAKKLNRFRKPIAVEIAETDDNGNTVPTDNNVTYDESISNSIAFAYGYDARYEQTYNSTQLESDSESDLESDSEADFQSSQMIPDGSSGDEYFSTEE